MLKLFNIGALWDPSAATENPKPQILQGAWGHSFEKAPALRKDLSMRLPIGPKVVPFWGSYLESYKVIPKKELLWGLWVGTRLEGCLRLGV